MAVSLPNGILIALATVYAAAKSVTILSNANPAVATAAAHGFAEGDFVEVTSGWSRLNGRVVRVGAVDTNTFELEGIDTSDVNLYPVGTGIGSVRQITAWQQITQVLDATTTGGDMQFATYSFLESDFESQLPTQSSAQSLTISVADDPALAGYQALRTASEQRTVRALRLTFPSGAISLYNGYLSFNETPSMTKNQVMACQGTFSLMSKPVRYAAPAI
ncbi:phage tail protein [Pigmentiphaga kullae]|uniref:Tail tube protein n=1 Tax=Pigmentiphaga kullae TaxID=151784 RepID=A0A4Q7NCK7_9BURK|nr:phage tail protein [Pigmentiphaga kullae]RZS80653.1 tail tube protein [Pigmentiphaga kullae]